MAEEDEQKIIVGGWCSGPDWQKDYLPGSELVDGTCGHPVVLSPEGLKFLIDNPGCQTRCALCVLSSGPDPDSQGFQTIPGAEEKVLESGLLDEEDVERAKFVMSLLFGQERPMDTQEREETAETFNKITGADND